MTTSQYLLGCKIITPTTTSEARAMIGRNVVLLTKSAIDKSGRGYFFPEYRAIVGACPRSIIVDGGISIALRDIVEIVDADEYLAEKRRIVAEANNPRKTASESQ